MANRIAAQNLANSVTQSGTEDWKILGISVNQALHLIYPLLLKVHLILWHLVEKVI